MAGQVRASEACRTRSDFMQMEKDQYCFGLQLCRLILANIKL
jgi:hypothetical protein